MRIQGKIVSGLGEGKIYVEKYLPLFVGNIDFTPFCGTLNIEVEELPILNQKGRKTITPEQPFYPVDYYQIKINNQYKGAIVIPHKTRHSKNTIEIIAPVNLREELKLNDGDTITCELV